jgi:hypothetical protein
VICKRPEWQKAQQNRSRLIAFAARMLLSLPEEPAPRRNEGKNR